MNKKHGLRIGIALLVLAAVFTLAGCEDLFSDGDSGETIEGNGWADSSGTLVFSYAKYLESGADECDVTTDLPAPNDEFTLQDTQAGGDSKTITGLDPNQEVNYTASVKKKTLTGSGSVKGRISFSTY
jgi:hypothetical protein